MATNGSDSNSGSASAPKKTVTSAVNAAPSGGTVVVRGGTYYESVTVPSSKPVTVQAYPREAVWFDATVAVGGFAPSGKNLVSCVDGPPRPQPYLCAWRGRLQDRQLAVRQPRLPNGRIP